MPILDIDDLKEISTLEQDEAVEYAEERGVDLLDDYGEILDLIDDESTVIAGNTKMRLVDLLEDILNDAEDIDQVEELFDEKSESGGYTIESNLAATQIAINSGYSSYSSAKRNQMEAQATDESVWVSVSVLDDKTTDECIALDGEAFAITDKEAFKKLFPPGHWNCRRMAKMIPNYKGTPSTFQQFAIWANPPEFWKTGKGYNYFPDGTRFSKNLYNAFINDMENRGVKIP